MGAPPPPPPPLPAPPPRPQVARHGRPPLLALAALAVAPSPPPALCSSLPSACCPLPAVPCPLGPLSCGLRPPSLAPRPIHHHPRIIQPWGESQGTEGRQWRRRTRMIQSCCSIACRARSHAEEELTDSRDREGDRHSRARAPSLTLDHRSLSPNLARPSQVRSRRSWL